MIDDEDMYVKGESNWPALFLLGLIVIMLLGILNLMIEVRDNTSRIKDPPRAEVYIVCDGTNCTFVDDLDQLPQEG